VSESFAQFQNQRSLALETYRKNGTPVITPVGFAQEGDALLIRTLANSWKVKRIQANRHVRIVPSDGRGQPLGEWVDASATILDATSSTQVRGLILAKYGLIWRGIEFANAIRARGKAEWVNIRMTRRPD